MFYWLLGDHNPNELYDSSVQKRLEGTCNWFLGRSTFLHWLSPDSVVDRAKLLWVNGPAGFGKTILCARVIEHLMSTFEAPVAHFFFSSDFENGGNPLVAVRSWKSQIIRLDEAAFDLVRRSRDAQQDRVATRVEIVRLFREVVLAASGCILILDGLDECSASCGMNF